MRFPVLSSLCVLGILCGNSIAAPPTIESVAPPVGERGAEFTITLTGARLDKPLELMLYAPGVVCTKLAVKDENEVTATLKAAADCKLGEYPFRLRTSGGASELRTFRISPFPVVAEHEPNDEKPQAVSLNVSVAGVTEAGGVDRFAVTLRKGQRLSAEVEGIRLGGERNDTAITVFDRTASRSRRLMTLAVPAGPVRFADRAGRWGIRVRKCTRRITAAATITATCCTSARSRPRPCSRRAGRPERK